MFFYRFGFLFKESEFVFYKGIFAGNNGNNYFERDQIFQEFNFN